MKNFKLLLLAIVGIAMVTFVNRGLAEDSDQVTLTGMLVCGKCKLHITDKCQNVLQVQKDGQTVNYFLEQNSVSKDFHSNICENDGEKVTVTGTVEEKDGKETMTPTKIEPVK
jgi:hypothetical protein